MTYHLHCHLEPEERKRRQLGKWRIGNQDPVSFFERHSLTGSVAKLSLEDLKDFLLELHTEQAREGSQYVELRFSPRRFIVDGYAWQEILFTVNETVMAMREPEIRTILLLNRDSPESFVREAETIIESGMPPAFVGVDLAGDEIRFPGTSIFRKCFLTAKATGLGVTVHAGEFGGEESIWMALDELGAQRIGHGLASVRSRSLLRRLRTDNILVEVSITSNLATGAIADASRHPLPTLMNWGVPVSLSTDVPVYARSSLQDEYRLANVLLGNIVNWPERMLDSAMRYAFRRH
jgi:adenosine deaminase